MEGPLVNLRELVDAINNGVHEVTRLAIIVVVGIGVHAVATIAAVFISNRRK